MFYIAFTKIMVSFTKKLCFIMQSDEDYEKCEQSEFIGWCGLGKLCIAAIDMREWSSLAHLCSPDDVMLVYTEMTALGMLYWVYDYHLILSDECITVLDHSS